MAVLKKPKTLESAALRFLKLWLAKVERIKELYDHSLISVCWLFLLEIATAELVPGLDNSCSSVVLCRGTRIKHI